jgi:peptidoglycan-N-acetylglucosamine deacetylase
MRIRIPLPGCVVGVRTREPVVALTFDDGPDPESTPRVLDLLARCGAHATFFMVGSEAARYPDLVASVAGAGHAIGNHTWDHPVLPRLNSADRRAQFRECQKALEPWGTELFRPPYLAQSRACRLQALRMRYKVILANVDSEDWWDPDPDRIAERLETGVRPGAIVLLHDAVLGSSGLRFPHEPRPDRGAMLQGLERFLNETGAGFRFLTVPELLRKGRAIRVRRYSKGPRPDPSFPVG